MKRLLLFGLLITSTAWSQSSETPNPTQVLAGYDENGYAIYKNIRPFYTLGSKIALGVIGGSITAIVIKIARDRKREDEQQESFEQQNVTI